MKALKITGWIVAAAVMFGIAGVSVAAATELDEWLSNGVEITSPLAAENESTGAIMLEDSGLGVEVEITIGEKGTVGPIEKDLIETVTILSSKFVKAGACTVLESVQAVNLPWTTELYLAGATFRDHILTETPEKAPGWLVECKTIFGKVVDTCTGNISTLVENTVEDVHTEFDAESLAETANCTIGGANTGLTLVGGGLLALAVSAELKLSVSSAAAPPPAPRVEWVDFTGVAPVEVDHEKNVFTEKAKNIEEVGGVDKVEWKSPKAAEFTKNWPVVYVQKENLKLEARFELAAATAEFLENKLGSDVTVTGEVVTGATTLTFTKVVTQANAEKQAKEHKTYFSSEALESNKLPEVARLYEGATIKWKWSAKEKGRLNGFEQSLGSSKHNIYATYEKIIGAESYLTLLDLDSAGLFEETQPLTASTALEGVWRGYKHLEEEVPAIHLVSYNTATGAITRGGSTFKYYAEVLPLNQTLQELSEKEAARCEAGTPAQLLEKGEGQCQAWAELFGLSLAIEGIHSKGVRVWAKWGAGAEPCAVLSACFFLVKNWEFAAGAGSVPGLFKYAPTEVKDTNGVQGQGIENPSSWFGNHVIVEVGSGLYDPSYGTAPITGAEQLKKYQAASIAGFCEGAFNCQPAPAALQLFEEEAFKY
jgi:hypothetical protein